MRRALSNGRCLCSSDAIADPGADRRGRHEPAGIFVRRHYDGQRNVCCIRELKYCPSSSRQRLCDGHVHEGRKRVAQWPADIPTGRRPILTPCSRTSTGRLVMNRANRNQLPSSMSMRREQMRPVQTKSLPYTLISSIRRQSDGSPSTTSPSSNRPQRRPQH